MLIIIKTTTKKRESVVKNKIVLFISGSRLRKCPTGDHPRRSTVLYCCSYHKNAGSTDKGLQVRWHIPYGRCPHVRNLWSASSAATFCFLRLSNMAYLLPLSFSHTPILTNPDSPYLPTRLFASHLLSS